MGTFSSVALQPRDAMDTAAAGGMLEVAASMFTSSSVPFHVSPMVTCVRAAIASLDGLYLSLMYAECLLRFPSTAR